MSRMRFRIGKPRKSVTAVAAVTATVAFAATVFAPAGFGSTLSQIGLWEEDPIVFIVPPIVGAGETLDCAVDLLDRTEEPDKPDEDAAAAVEPKNVIVYSDPPGAIYYNGNISGSTAVITVHVSEIAPPGPVTVYLKVGDCDPVSSQTTVVPN